MVFNSFEFLIFLPIVVFLYFVLPHKLRWIMLLAASYYFYLSWNVELIFLIVFTTVISYVCAIVISRTKSRGLRNICFILTLISSLGVLFFFKYFDFLANSAIEIVALISGSSVDEFTLGLLLPVGISFYTFQTLSYVIDVYRGRVEPEYHFGYYALYVSFFPQLVAGPIERPENLLPQLHAHSTPCRDDFVAGAKMMLIGFFKKIVVADLCAAYVVNVYDSAESATGLSVVIATVAFAFQIYGDFAGYTDIAIGCARVMGIKLMQNFDRPYTAQSIKEFWNRWHISLSSWFRDYLYFPLGGSRCAKWRHMLNLMTVFLVSGLWHGAAWTYVLWGAIHGAYQIVGHLTQKYRERALLKLGFKLDSKGAVLRRRMITFALVCFAWIFFRATTFEELSVLLSKLFCDWSLSEAYIEASIASLGMDAVGALTAVLSVIIMDRMDKNKLAPKYTSLPCDGGNGATLGTSSFKYVYIVWAVAIAWLILLAGDGESSFIYFQF